MNKKDVLKKIEVLKEKYDRRDYQNRKGNYPRGDIPDSSELLFDENSGEISLEFEFKNNSEIATKWAAKNFPGKTIDADDIGDYYGDWATVTVVLGNAYDPEQMGLIN